MLTFAVGLAALLQSGFAAWTQHRTIDEPMHLQWARRLLDTGETERESQYMYNSKTPGTLPHVVAMRAAHALGVEGGRALRFAGRLASVALLGLLLGVVYAMGRSLFGERAGLLASLGCALDPNLIAHGSLSTLDLPFALAALLALWAAIGFANRPGTWRALLLGAGVGLALTVKFSAVLIVVGLAFLPLARDRDAPPWRARRVVLSGAAALVVCCLTISAGYLFQRVGEPLSGVEWQSSPLRTVAGLAPWLPLPVPADFLTGIDISFQHERAVYEVVMLERMHRNGVWYYFALLWLLKTPVLLLVATLGGLLLGLRAGLLKQPAARFLGANLLLLVLYFSLVFHAQVGYRFVLMCVPVGCLLAAPGLAALPAVPRLQRLGVLIVVTTLAENALYLGNPLSFTNAAVLPKTQVFRLISDSNIDWGQNDDELERWRQLPELAGAHWEPPHALPGLNVFSANTLTMGRGFERYRWLRGHADPIRQLGYTHLVFDVEPAFFEQMLSEDRRRPGSAAPVPGCPPVEQLVAWPREGLPIEEGGGAEWGSLCTFDARSADVVLEVERGLVAVGDCARPARERDVAGAGQAVWYRLDPGFHRLCAEAVSEPARARWRAPSGGPLVARQGPGAGLSWGPKSGSPTVRSGS